MRTIDADAIPYTMLYKENWMTGTGKEAQGAWKSDIDKMPTIDAVPVKHGKWIKEDDAIITGMCSVCGWNSIFAETDVCGMPFCPNCGASMDRGKDDE